MRNQTPIYPAVQLEHVSRIFGATVGVVQADVEIETGSVTVLRGRNGAGKSTLLRLVATELSPTYGSGHIFGLDLERDRVALRPRLAFVGHATRIYGDLTVRENLRFWTRLVGASQESVTPTLERVDLMDRAGDLGRDLSKGMRQRLALACAIARAPELLLLDEPYSGLDGAGKDMVDELVSETHREGRTVILASHDLSRPSSADRELVMSRGRIVGDDRSTLRSVIG